MTHFVEFHSIGRPRLSAKAVRMGSVLGTAVLAVSLASAQAPTPSTPLPTPSATMSIPAGYDVHNSVDVGGRMTDLSGSPAMYSTLVNLQSGPRVMNETFSMHALPGTKHGWVDSLTATSNGFGGDPENFAKLDFSKGKWYEFSGVFRRYRQYSDYNLLGNPNIPGGAYGQYMPIGPSNAPTGQIAWPQVQHSSMLYNTVRRMTDVNLTLMPVSVVTYRAGYFHNTMEGPSLSPAYSIAKYDALLEQYLQHTSDDYFGAVDWKPLPRTRVSFEEQVNHYRMDSYYTLDPNSYIAQEADGTPVYLGNWDSVTPYGIGACNTASMGSGYTDSTHYTIFSAPQTSGGLPVINPACAVVTSYMRTLPTSITTPTEMLRFQSSDIPNVSMTGNVRYTLATSDLSNYYEDAEGLSGAIRSIVYTGGYARAHREVLSADYALTWQATKTVALSEQVNFYSMHQPGYSNVPIADTLSTPGAPDQTINYSGPLTPGHAQSLPHGIEGEQWPGYLGNQNISNNFTISWDALPRATFSLGYHFGHRKIGEGAFRNNCSEDETGGDPTCAIIEITENGGIFNAALRPTNNWSINGTVELIYADNAFTTMTPRQLQRYKIRTIFHPKPWASLAISFNDLERHNNTYNADAKASNAAGDTEYYGPLAHEDHTRVASISGELAPNEHYGINFSYAYSDVYTATNICFTSGAASAFYPGVATVDANGQPNVCPGIYARGTTNLVDFYARDFMDAPTQSGTVAFTTSPVNKVKMNLGYRISSVAGSQFFNDARAVNGSLESTYQSPYASIEWAMRPKLVWRAEYNHFGYGEGGVSGAKLCSTTVSTTAEIIPCDSSTITGPTGLTEGPAGLTTARNFHANHVILGVHYEF